MSDHQAVITSDRHGEAAATLRVIHRGTLASIVIQNDFAARPRGAGRRSSGSAPGQGPVPVNHAKGGDAVKGTRTPSKAHVRHPAVEATGSRSLRRGAVVVSGHTSPPEGVGVT